MHMYLPSNAVVFQLSRTRIAHVQLADSQRAIETLPDLKLSGCDAEWPPARAL